MEEQRARSGLFFPWDEPLAMEGLLLGLQGSSDDALLLMQHEQGLGAGEGSLEGRDTLCGGDVLPAQGSD